MTAGGVNLGEFGLTAWALTTLVAFYLLTTTVGGLLGGTYRTVTSALSNVTQAVGSTAQTAAQVAAPNLAGAADPFSSIEQAIRGNTGGNDPAALRDAAVAAVRGAVTGNEQQYGQFAEAKQQTTQAADAASSAVSVAALLGALGLILGAVAAWFGGRMGAVEPTITAPLSLSRTNVTDSAAVTGHTTSVEADRTRGTTSATGTRRIS